MSEDPDVRIVGGSLVGLSAALWLRLHVVRCLTVGVHSSTAIHPRAGHFQGAESLGQLLCRGAAVNPSVHAA